MALTGLAYNQTHQPKPAAPTSGHRTFGQMPVDATHGAHAHAAATTAQPQRALVHSAPSSTTPMPQSSGTVMGEVRSNAITDKDIGFLTSLAAMQIQYGRPHEAVAYLMSVRRMCPSDPQILRLLAIALMKMEAWDQAMVILDEMESLRGNESPIVYLYRSIIRFRQLDLFGAKQLFARFCALKSGGNHP